MAQDPPGSGNNASIWTEDITFRWVLAFGVCVVVLVVTEIATWRRDTRLRAATKEPFRTQA